MMCRRIAIILFWVAVSALSVRTQGPRIVINPNLTASTQPSAPRKVIVKTQIRTITVTVTQTKIVERKVFLHPTTGSLAVAAQPNADILLVRERSDKNEGGKIPATETIVAFNNLPPGHYTIKAVCVGYLDSAEQEVIVKPGEVETISFNLQPVTYKVALRTNVSTGEIRYASANSVLKTDQARPLSDTRPFCIVKIVNGRADFPALLPGRYDVDIRADEVGYQTYLGFIDLPGPEVAEVKLERKVSSTDFVTNWSQDEWQMPNGWSITDQKMVGTGGGVALPKSDNYLHYIDFHMTSDARMINGVAASWAVRAQDARNYYLIQVTGSQADEPFVLRAFVVKDGQVGDRLGTTNVSHLAQSLKTGQFFRLHIKGQGNTFKVFLEDSQNGGDLLPLGNLTDPQQTYRIGGMGVAATPQEQTEYGSFIVCPGECKIAPAIN